MTPRLTVLIAARNAAPYVAQSLGSILAQEYRDFECLVIDDGSTDATAEIVAKLAEGDARIRLMRQQGMGLAAALNAGLAQARGEYLARMDADDLSLPRRFSAQLAYLDAHPAVAAVGCSVRTFGATWPRTWAYPESPAAAKAMLLFANPLAHPAVMARTRGLVEAGGYDTSFAYCQDYALWEKLSRAGELANIGQVLLRYRVHAGQMGSSYGSDVRRQEYMRVQANVLATLGVNHSPDDLEFHHYLSVAGVSTTPPRCSAEILRRAERWLVGLKKANAAKGFAEPDAFNAELSRRWFGACAACSGLGSEAFRTYRASELYKPGMISAKSALLFRFAALCGVDATYRMGAHRLMRAVMKRTVRKS